MSSQPPLVYVDRFTVAISSTGLLYISTFSQPPPAEGEAAVKAAGPAIAMTIVDAECLAGLITKSINRARELAKQAASPN